MKQYAPNGAVPQFKRGQWGWKGASTVAGMRTNSELKHDQRTSRPSRWVSPRWVTTRRTQLEHIQTASPRTTHDVPNWRLWATYDLCSAQKRAARIERSEIRATTLKFKYTNRERLLTPPAGAPRNGSPSPTCRSRVRGTGRTQPSSSAAALHRSPEGGRRTPGPRERH